MSTIQKTGKVILNRTLTYLLPIIGLTLGIEKAHLFDLKGVFMFNERHQELQDGYLHVLFEFKKTIHFDIVSKLFDDPSGTIITQNYQPDNYHHLYIFKIPQQYKREYYTFLQGKYSELPEDYKNYLIKFHNYLEPDKKKIINILYKKEQMYLDQEEYINKGLPLEHWTRIPRGLEIAGIWNQDKENILMETLTKEILNKI